MSEPTDRPDRRDDTGPAGAEADSGARSVWDWVVSEDGDRFGQDIFDPQTRRRWCAAIFTGGLPYLWQQVATVPRDVAVERLELRPGDHVLILGEAVEAIGFDDLVRRHVGDDGDVTVIDVRDRVLSALMNGELPRWQYDETAHFADRHFDVVFVAQANAHAADWAATGAELLRVMKSGRRLVIAEIAFSSTFQARAANDVHLEYWLRKLVEGMGYTDEVLLHWDLRDLEAALGPQLDDVETFEWRGVELLWGRKP